MKISSIPVLREKRRVYYLANNNGKFYENRIVNFDDIQIPKYRRYTSDLGPKDYEYINNVELQESVDYLTVINNTRAQKRRELVMKQRKMEEEKTLVDKAQESATEAKKTFSNLFKKFFGGDK